MAAIAEGWSACSGFVDGESEIWRIVASFAVSITVMSCRRRGANVALHAAQSGASVVAADFSTASTWEFEPLDAEVFPAVELARAAGQRGGCLTAVYNAANEEAAEAFLQGRIRFPAIVRTIAEVLHAADQWSAEPATVEDVLDAQRWARMRAGRAVSREG